MKPTQSDMDFGLDIFNHLAGLSKNKINNVKGLAQLIADHREQAEIEKQEQFDRMAAYILTVMREVAWEGGNLYGADAQELGESFGLLKPFTVTPEDIDNGKVDYCEVGDTAYSLPDWLIEAAKRHEARKEK